jgi:hypothetical protein
MSARCGIVATPLLHYPVSLAQAARSQKADARARMTYQRPQG